MTPEQIAREAAERLVPIVGPDNTWVEIYGKIRLNVEQSILTAARLIAAQEPATIPAQPKKEPTQFDMDEMEFDKQFKEFGSMNSSQKIDAMHYRRTAWHAALVYRDAQNREDLANIEEAYSNGLKPSREKLSRIRRRCGLEK